MVRTIFASSTVIFMYYNKNLIIKVLFSILALFLTVSCHNNTTPEQSEPEKHELLTVSARDYTINTEFPASIQGNQDIKIIPRVEGHLMGVYVKEGEPVQEGNCCFASMMRLIALRLRRLMPMCR